MSDQPQTTVESQWIIQCWDGCVLTFWNTDDAAIEAFRDHHRVGHRAALFAPGIFDPKQFNRSFVVRAE